MDILKDALLPRRQQKSLKSPEDPVRDLKSYLTCLERSSLVVLAGKYKIKICKSGRKQQMIDTFANRVPSDMIGIICDDLESQEIAVLRQKNADRAREG